MFISHHLFMRFTQCQPSPFTLFPILVELGNFVISSFKVYHVAVGKTLIGKEQEKGKETTTDNQMQMSNKLLMQSMNQLRWNFKLHKISFQINRAMMRMILINSPHNSFKIINKNVFTKCCFQGKVTLPPVTLPSANIIDLFSAETPQSRHFMENICHYNAA